MPFPVTPDLIEPGVFYAAGLYEGEGTAYANKRSGAMIAINMTDEEPLLRFASAVGIGTVKGPYEYKTRPGTKPYWRWRVSDWKGVHTVARLLYPHLSLRRQRQLETMLSRFRGVSRQCRLQ